MAIAQMAKFIIVSHREQVAQLLEALQNDGICQILNAQEAAVSKNWPDLSKAADRHKDIESFVSRLDGSIKFLSGFLQAKTGLAHVLAPRVVVDRKTYDEAVSNEKLTEAVDHALECEAEMERLRARIDELHSTIEQLSPWKAMAAPVEDIGSLRRFAGLTGLIPSQYVLEIAGRLGEMGAVIEQIGRAANKCACLVLCPRTDLGEIQRLLRASDFEPVSFEGLTGTIAELIAQYNQRLSEAKSLLISHHGRAAELSRYLPSLEILYDHYQNLLRRENTMSAAPATDATVILEGWVKAKDYVRLEKIVSRFSAASIGKIAPAEGEEIPVDIENPAYVEPFEVITRLYGMPQPSNVDPTVFLAPFFALFFGICLGDAGYGLVTALAAVLLAGKMQGDKKLVWLLGICSLFAIVVGALTGSWFGDAIPRFARQLDPLRTKLMWFDPMQDPLLLLGLSAGLGYVHLVSGLVIAFVHNLRARAYGAAVFEQLTWLVMLNAIVVFGLSKAGVVPVGIGGFLWRLALVPAVLIVLFTSRQGGWGGRIALGAYSLFTAVFYLGDVLSYLRLMALCMVGSGLGMAMNIMAEQALKIPYVGILLMAVVFVAGHLLNVVLSVLGAFVHTMRLQFVEFFPKFLAGGGRTFEPLRKEYKHICLERA